MCNKFCAWSIEPTSSRPAPSAPRAPRPKCWPAIPSSRPISVFRLAHRWGRATPVARSSRWLLQDARRESRAPTVASGIEFHNIGIQLPVLRFGEMNFSYARLLSFIAALVGMVAVYVFMKRTYTGTAIRAIAQDRQIMALMGVDTRRIYLITSAIGGGLAGLAACLLVLQYDVHPFVGLSFGPITFLICVLGGLGNFIGGFIAAFVFAEIISLGGLFSDLAWGYVLALAFFIVMMVIRAAGLVARRS